MTSDPGTNNESGRRTDPPSRVRELKVVLSLAALLLGLATIVVTLANGGGIASRGILLGAILALMASMRLYLTLKHRI